MSFYLEIKASLLKDVVKAIENINAESIWVIDHEGIYIRMSDVYRYKMLEININNRDMVNFKFDSTKPYYLGLVIDRLKDVTKTLKSSDLLIMDYSDGNPFITAESNGLKRNIKLIDISLIGQPPELMVSQEYQSVIESKKMLSFLKAISKSISFDVIINQGKFIIRSETDEGLAEISWSEEDCNLDTQLSESVTNFSTAEITKALVACKNNLVIKGSNDSPVSFEWELASNSTIKSLVAPRV